jgi:hypothetical protein
LSAEIVRPQVALHEVHDGDTYWVLVNWLRDKTPPWNHAELVSVRLRDYSARELRDTAVVDPKGLNRVDGPTATQIAAAVLTSASDITVEFQGLDSMGRPVVWVWIDTADGAGLSLGQVLLAKRAVAQIAAMG